MNTMELFLLIGGLVLLGALLSRPVPPIRPQDGQRGAGMWTSAEDAQRQALDHFNPKDEEN